MRLESLLVIAGDQIPLPGYNRPDCQSPLVETGGIEAVGARIEVENDCRFFPSDQRPSHSEPLPLRKGLRTNCNLSCNIGPHLVGTIVAIRVPTRKVVVVKLAFWAAMLPCAKLPKNPGWKSGHVPVAPVANVELRIAIVPPKERLCLPSGQRALPRASSDSGTCRYIDPGLNASGPIFIGAATLQAVRRGIAQNIDDAYPGKVDDPKALIPATLR